MAEVGHTPDEFNLNRFIEAQQSDYDRALAEIRAGQKRSHWMWYIFPQLTDLGRSSTARFYGIKGMAEAKAFLAHPLLGARLIECMNALLLVEGRTAEQIFGFPDVLKLRSCATLFAEVSDGDSVFDRVLEKYYSGEPDSATVRLLKGQGM